MSEPAPLTQDRQPELIKTILLMVLTSMPVREGIEEEPALQLLRGLALLGEDAPEESVLAYLCQVGAGTTSLPITQYMEMLVKLGIPDSVLAKTVFFLKELTEECRQAEQPNGELEQFVQQFYEQADEKLQQWLDDPSNQKEPGTPKTVVEIPKNPA